MKKSLLNLGTALSKSEQKQISGGNSFVYPLGYCLAQGTNPPQVIAQVPCNEKCPDGSTPFCYVFDDGIRN
ncbi:hypothetical protein [Aquimarina sp. MMG016]|uniref:hypothetical protein n=1 Tax=Aquimarina sp. MMG016 TaxID=2822690 RepID=UPI001B3A66D3|nr:hypothetical protein [Aquimarina sp. MMG016]MBQ4818908.1 hypothetical protein [Aquimarina sp. MMG016]